MIWYFWKELKPFIKAKIEQRNCELDSFKELVEKVVEAEAKAALQPGFYTRETDFRYLWSTCPAYIAKVQGSSKKSKPEEP